MCPRQPLRHKNDDKHDGIHVGVWDEQLKREARLITHRRRSRRSLASGPAPRVLSVSAGHRIVQPT